MLIRKFQRHGFCLELDDALRPVAVFRTSDRPKEEPVMGFFVDEPELIFVAPSTDGPVIGWRNGLIPVGRSTSLWLEGEGARRQLLIRPEAAPAVAIPAAPAGIFDPNFPDEEDMTDFYVWLVEHVPTERAQIRMTLG